MKLSQHFKTFETEIKTWHDRILNISNVLNVWMDVQRKWVYLEGIFMGSSPAPDFANYFAFRAMPDAVATCSGKACARISLW